MRGSWPVLLVLAGLFLTGFAALRSGSAVLRAEQQQDAMRALAARSGLPPACVLALRARSLRLDDAAFTRLVERFARLRGELGEPLAALAVFDDEAVARAALTAAGGDPVAAWQQCRSEPMALPGVWFAQLRDRFAARASGRSP